MAYFIKNFENITASLIQSVSESTTAITDFNVGSVVRTMLEAFAEELEYFYMQMFRGILEGIDTAVYESFDFPLLGAIAASGPLTLSLYVNGTTQPLAPLTPITIPSGFRFQVPTQGQQGNFGNGLIYSTVNSFIWPAGQTNFTINVVCATAGSVGNVIAGSITEFVDTMPNVLNGYFTVTNGFPFISGQDSESNDERKVRFSQYLQSLSRGTVDAIEYGALQAVVVDANGNIIEQVKKVVAIEPYQIDGSKPTGYVDVYIYNGVGATSSTLVLNTQKIIDGYVDSNNNKIPGYKAAGIIVNAQAATEQQQNFVLNTTWNSGYDLTSDIQSQIAGAISHYVNSLNPGDTLVYNELIRLVMDTTGIYNVQFTSPSSDVVPSNNQTIITLGSITIS